MSNEHVVDELVAYISSNLDEDSTGRVRRHLESCPACRREYDGALAFWQVLAELPEEEPNPSMRTKFYRMLRSAERSGLRRTLAGLRENMEWLGELFSKRRVLQAGFVMGVLVIGSVIGYHLRSDHDDGAAIAQLHNEVRGIRRLLTISLLQQQSATERLQGVSWSYRMGKPDPEIIKALLETLKYDPNVNVRLAALDALGSSLSQPDVRHELIESLPRQSSPLVQLALVDVMIQLGDRESVGTFRQMMKDPGLNTTVKKRLEQGIQQLSGA